MPPTSPENPTPSRRDSVFVGYSRWGGGRATLRWSGAIPPDARAVSKSGGREKFMKILLYIEYLCKTL